MGAEAASEPLAGAAPEPQSEEAPKAEAAPEPGAEEAPEETEPPPVGAGAIPKPVPKPAEAAATPVETEAAPLDIEAVPGAHRTGSGREYESDTVSQFRLLDHFGCLRVCDVDERGQRIVDFDLLFLMCLSIPRPQRPS